jgi:hypothetical protein
MYFCREELATSTIRRLACAWLVGLAIAAYWPDTRFMFSSAVAIADIVLLVLVFGPDARNI